MGGVCLTGLAVALLAANGAGAERSAPPNGLVAQLYVWTQHYNQKRERMDEHFDEVFAATKRAGYDAVQGFLNVYDTHAAAGAYAAKLKEHELTMPIAYVGGPMHTQELGKNTIETIVRQAENGVRHGLQVVVHNPNPIGREKTDEELAVQAENLDALGAELRAWGIYLAIHSHAPEMKTGAREWYHILRHTKPENVSICLDLHWVLRGGQDPYKLLADARGRVIDLHLRNSRGGVWSEDLADGDIDYARVAGVLRKIGYRGTYTVELAYESHTQKSRSLEDNLRLSGQYARRVLFSE
jgi:inosose dehydratase